MEQKRIAIDFFTNNNEQRTSDIFSGFPTDMAGRVFYHCKNHDYVYFPTSFEDNKGIRRRAGYYDETGQYYSELKIYETLQEGEIICKFCGYKLSDSDEDELKELKCPKCAASLHYLERKIFHGKASVSTGEIRFTDRTDAEARRYVYEPEYPEKKPKAYTAYNDNEEREQQNSSSYNEFKNQQSLFSNEVFAAIWLIFLFLAGILWGMLENALF